MLEAVLMHMNNWFDRDGRRYWHVESGELSIEGGSLLGAGGWLAEGQYFRIEGSRLNDGLHQHPADDLHDEVFEGRAYELRIPAAVVELAERIGEWEQANGEASRGLYASQSVPTLSVTMREDIAAPNGLTGWQAAFAGELKRWKKAVA